MTDEQRQALRGLVQEAIETYYGKVFEHLEEEARHYANLKAVIELAHPEDQPHLLERLGPEPAR